MKSEKTELKEKLEKRFNCLLKDVFNRDTGGLYEICSPDIHIFGTNMRGIVGVEQVAFYMREKKLDEENVHICLNNLKTQILSSHFCLMTCGASIETDFSGKTPESYFLWISCLWKKEMDCWKIQYLHLSHGQGVEIGIKFHGCMEQEYWLYPDRILYIEARNMKSEVHSQDGFFILQEQLGACEKKLPGYFMRIHRSYLVNVYFIRKVEKYRLRMITGESIPIPEKRYQQILSEIMAHIV
ncbi:MAG: LytTR family DNA-binding domain-containing protein [Eubacteriales bacterium]|nr:LytTR family DNA-binding domain-containing protein [Eubacteriales bacterium]